MATTMAARASPSTTFRGAPPAMSTTYNVLSPWRDDGSTISSVANAICFPSGRPRGIETDIGEPAHRFARRARHEDAPDGVRLVKRDQRSVGREGRPALVALRIVDDRRRVPPADALGVDVPASVHADRVGDGAAVGRKARRRFLAGRFGDPGELVPARLRHLARSAFSSHDAPRGDNGERRDGPRQPRSRARGERGAGSVHRRPMTTSTRSRASRARTRDRSPTETADRATSRDSAGRSGRGPAEMDSRAVSSSGGSFVRIAVMVSAAVSPLNARSPLSIS